jgi:hypothetical protein
VCEREGGKTRYLDEENRVDATVEFLKSVEKHDKIRQFLVLFFVLAADNAGEKAIGEGDRREDVRGCL